VAIINLKDTVFIPDFAFRHTDGRTALLEIVGFWRPEYLERKFMKLRRSGRTDMVVAVSADLNVGEEDLKDVPGSVLFFKHRLNPKEVVARLEQVGQDATEEVLGEKEPGRSHGRSARPRFPGRASPAISAGCLRQ